ncbi:hypothetical protein PPERSA_12636 [Pseudocohnilembus persalinus]|uniref:Uncharacterized protein n=1 Tax=Pseudocohnilembus persalinus TaxID=266149 RepID=A0A0V0QCM9_PSEPJ|nr:hypothetical protein PPERSA_12636 [Pseudocohnilembus persalinus]|eukprot:KRW99960.1 hypothetical protein PPERSA_12636 [Pseudocohnilembus persalinus]
MDNKAIDSSQSGNFNQIRDIQRSFDNVSRKLEEKQEEVTNLLLEQRYLREENSKLRLTCYKLEQRSGKKDSGDQSNMQRSQNDSEIQENLKSISQSAKQAQQRARNLNENRGSSSRDE